MQRLSIEVRDLNNSAVRGVIRSRGESQKTLVDESSKIETGCSHLTSIVEISTEQGGFQTPAILDESGEFDRSMREWTVYFLEKDQPSSCSIEDLIGLEIRVSKRFGVNFKCDTRKIHARMHDVESEGVKSIIFTIGNELKLLAKSNIVFCFSNKIIFAEE